MVGRDVGDIEALHDARRAGEVEFLAEFGEILERLDGARQAAAAAELARGCERLGEVLPDVAQVGGLFEFKVCGGLLHFRLELL